MNADLKRVRGTGLDDAISPSSKRRALGASTPPPNEGDDDVEDWMKVVETKRKEAIYRQMLEYRRSHEQEAKRANELEAQRQVLEASVQAFEICWTQLVTSILLLGGENLQTKEEVVLQPLFEPQISQPALAKALQDRLPQTQKLVSRFVEISSVDGHRSTSQEELHSRCQRLQAESSTLRSNSVLLKSQVSTLNDDRDQLERDLIRAKKTLDRQRMDFDRAQQEWSLSRDQEKGNGTPKNSGSGHATPNGKAEEDIKPLIEAGSSSGMLQDNSELETVAEDRLRRLESLHNDFANLQQENDRLRLLANNPSEASLRESPFFQVYLQQLSTYSSRANALQQHYELSEKKLDELKDSNFDFREAVIAEARQEIDSLRQQGIRKDADLARLRGQRDEMNAELSERRSKEGERTNHTEEIERLANARSERIIFLTSEVRRLKGKLAAGDGAGGYLSFLRGDGGIDGDYVKHLEDKITSAEILSTSDHTELANAKMALAKYERIIGPDATEDVQELGRKLKTADEEKIKVSLQLSEAEAATNALYSEVEGLSKLWENLERSANSKVFDLKEAEAKVARSMTEKAKADNKYFQAMRAKEAIDAECKIAQRSVEKQLKLLERAQEVEKSLNGQIAAHEKGLTALKNAAMDLQTELATATSEKTQLELRYNHSQTLLEDAQRIVQQRVNEAKTEKLARERLQEEADASSRAVKKLKEKQESSAAANISASEWQMKEERDKLLKLLRCSCCEQNFKQQVIVKCMHTFCKPCLDARIASRQRKCPACGLAFAKEDVQTLYWQ